MEGVERECGVVVVATFVLVNPVDDAIVLVQRDHVHLEDVTKCFDHLHREALDATRPVYVGADGLEECEESLSLHGYLGPTTSTAT